MKKRFYREKNRRFITKIGRRRLKFASDPLVRFIYSFTSFVRIYVNRYVFVENETKNLKYTTKKFVCFKTKERFRSTKLNCVCARFDF